MKPRTVYSTITVDLVKGDGARSDMFPETRSIEISTDALIPQLTPTQTAIETARTLVMRWLRHNYKVYKVPDIELVQQQHVYKAFFYTRGHKDEVLLIDTVKGLQLEELE